MNNFIENLILLIILFIILVFYIILRIKEDAKLGVGGNNG